MKSKTQLFDDDRVLIDDLPTNLIQCYNAINKHVRRLLKCAYALYIDEHNVLHADDAYYSAIVHIIITVPPLYVADDVFDEESLDNVCTLLDYLKSLS